MQATFTDLAQRMFVGPVWPASILVCLLVVYTLIALIGLIELDFDAPDLDLDADVSGGLDAPELDGIDVDLGGADVNVSHHSGLDFINGLAATTVRWTNFGRVPVVVWMGVFTFLFWMISYGLWHGFDSKHYAPTWIPSLLLIVRNGVISIIATKYATQPAVGKFSPPAGYDKHRLMGATCEISSISATPTFGQAKFRTNAAPLLLNVRTNGTEIPKGTEVRIVDFDPIKRIYTVTEILPENDS
ncbi:YqiJ family protein [Stieleria sp. TO1_6]|uniref:OB-fold-containig protein n=1 Tax=Stieleria tagensis TaxID=2956795 RepID=UPI00209B481E|nr:OB-fold-containig protein [Stieleria tagensis]MCO8123581.1 YqiJ family protein [Stieleria tagensis]